MKLTKQAIKRLQESPKVVRLLNGYFNKVSVTANFSRYSVELCVDVVHPLLERFGFHNKTELIYWKSYNGCHIDIPEELNPLIDEMKLLGTISDEKAQSRLLEMEKMVRDFYEEFKSF